jgi:hypothetical protein
MEWIERVCCEKFRFGFDRTIGCITCIVWSYFTSVFVQKISIWIRLSNMVHDEEHCDRFCTGVCVVSKWSDTHSNMSLESNGIDWTLPLRKTMNRIRLSDMVHYEQYRDLFCIGVCVVLKWSDTHPNMSLRSNGVHWMLPLRKRTNRIGSHDRDWFCTGVCAVSRWS